MYLSPQWSSTATSASELRTMHVARALQHVGEVEVIPVIDGGSDLPSGDDTNATFKLGEPVRAQVQANRWTRKLRWPFDSRLPYPHGLAVDAQTAQSVRTAALDADLVWFYKLRTANLFPDLAWPHSVVDIDDVPSTFEHSLLARQPTWPRLVTRMREWSWRRREQILGERFSVLTVCSDADRTYLTQLGVDIPIHVVANGFERPDRLPTRRPTSPPRLGFIGVLDHAPNAEGIHWFSRECWPLIKREVPDARLRLVGRFTDGPLKPDGEAIEALGFLPDVAEEMSTWAAMVVPIRTGAGTRGKIAHAFSQKCPVVSTHLGAYGYAPNHGENMLLADAKEDFASACVFLIRQPLEASAIAERAWAMFLADWTWDAIRQHVWAAAEDCLSSGRVNTISQSGASSSRREVTERAAES